MGALNDLTADLASTLTGEGLEVITDPRQLRPNVCLIEPPRVSGISGNLSTVEWDVQICAQPPGDDTAVALLLDQVDIIIEAVPVTSATPGVFSSGGQDLPAYTCTVRQTIRRN